MSSYFEIKKIFFLLIFYPTAFNKGCAGIVFTHGIWMGRPAVGRSVRQRERACLGYISETMRCKMLVLGRDIG